MLAEGVCVGPHGCPAHISQGALIEKVATMLIKLVFYAISILQLSWPLANTINLFT